MKFIFIDVYKYGAYSKVRYALGKMALPIADYYTLDVENVQRVKRFNTEATGYNVHFKNINKVEDWFNFFPDLFDDLIARTTSGCMENDRVGIEINHPSLDTPVLVPFMPHSELNSDKVLSVVERVQQSNTNFEFNDAMNVKVVIVKYINMKKMI